MHFHNVLDYIVDHIVIIKSAEKFGRTQVQHSSSCHICNCLSVCCRFYFIIKFNQVQFSSIHVPHYCVALYQSTQNTHYGNRARFPLSVMQNTNFLMCSLFCRALLNLTISFWANYIYIARFMNISRLDTDAINKQIFMYMQRNNGWSFLERHLLRHSRRIIVF